MTRRRRGRSIRIRLALAAAAVVAAATALVAGGVYWWTLRSLERATDRSIAAELADVLAVQRTGDAQALAAEVERRSVGAHAGDLIYVLAQSHYQVIAGNLAHWPEGLPGHAEIQTVVLREVVATTRVERRLRAVARTLPDGRHLLVGADVTRQDDVERVLRASALSALALASLLAIAGGITVSRNLLRRVEGMNRTVLRILAGRSSERVPVSRGGDEFDDLAAQFNRLLDEKQRLIEQTREVTNDIAHDLRTPLARMRSHVESIVAQPGDAQRTEATLRDLLVEIDRLLETFNALLQIAQVESGVLRDDASRVELEPIVRDAAELYQPLAEEARVVLETELAPGLAVLGHRELLAHALANLIDNAIKYGGSPGRVRVSTRLGPRGAELAVSDRGPGIAARDRERALRRFVRLDSSRRLPGTGLGLAFVAAVAELHGAEIALEDAGPGLRVVLSFPGDDAGDEAPRT